MSWTRLFLFIVDEVNKIPADEGKAVLKEEEEEEIPLNLVLSSDPKAGEETVGVPVSASMPNEQLSSRSAPKDPQVSHPHPPDGITHVFHTILGRVVVKPALFLHMAWAHSRLTGMISFWKIRNSVSTQVSTQECHSC